MLRYLSLASINRRTLNADEQGRRNVSSILFKFNLVHRHDFIMWFYDTVLYPVNDTVQIQVDAAQLA